jgi:DNA-binding SARP family transcriptional activator/nucleoid-associated protein YgaU
VAVSTVVECAAAVTGRAVPALRGLGALQRPASYLVALITTALTAPTVTPALAATPAAATITTAAMPAQAAAAGPAAATGGYDLPPRHTAGSGGPARQALRPETGAPAPDPGGPPTPPEPAPPTATEAARPVPLESAGRWPAVRVEQYDSLWRLAQRHLGDGRRWNEIYHLNQHRTQPDGQRLTDPAHIRPGWTLLLPADATGTTLTAPADTPDPASTTAAASGGRTVVVRPGDTLSGIAEQRLGTAAATAALYAANTGRTQPDGHRLTDPDLIRPGWTLTLPTTASHTSPDRPPTATPTPAPRRRPPAPRPPTPSAPAPPSPPAPTTDAPRGSPPPASAEPSPGQTAEPSSPPTTTAPPPSPAGTTGQPEAPASRSQPSTAAPVPRHDQRWVQLPSGSILALSLITTLTALIALARRRRRQHRQPEDPYQLDPLPEQHRPADDASSPVVDAVESAWLDRRRHDTDDIETHDAETDDTEGLDFPVERDTDAAADEQDDDGIEDPNDPEPFGPGVTDLDETRAPFRSHPGPVARSRGVSPATGSDWPHSPVVHPESGEPASDHITAAGRGRTAGGLPAPSLLDLTGPPEAAALARPAWAGGVGLTGPGAEAAARAVAVRLLTAVGPMGAELITTSDTLAQLLPADAADAVAAVPGVRVYPTLAGALGACEAELLGRTRRLTDTDAADLATYRQLSDAEPIPAVLLLATAPDSPAHAARAHALFTLAAGRDLGAIWLGPWTPALRIEADGTLRATARPANSDRSAAPSDVGRAELLTATDAGELLADLLTALRDSLDLLDPSTLLPTPTPTPTADTASAGEPTGRPGVDPADADQQQSAAVGTVPTDQHGAALLTVAVFGRVRVGTSDGGEVTGLRAKVRDLVALLAVHPDGLSGEQVGEALWPDAPPARVAGRLSATLALARRALREAAGLIDPDSAGAGSDGASGAEPSVAGQMLAGPADLIPREDGRYRLHRRIDTDYRRLFDALAAGRQARDAGDRPGEIAALRVVADTYRGEALDGVAYPWAEPVREAVRRRACDALATLADLLTPDAASTAAGDVGDAAAALAALEQAIEADPYAEELYRRAMRLHARAGRTDAVRRTLRLLEARLADIDVDPVPETTELAAALLRRTTRTAATSSQPKIAAPAAR